MLYFLSKHQVIHLHYREGVFYHESAIKNLFSDKKLDIILARDTRIFMQIRHNKFRIKGKI